MSHAEGKIVIDRKCVAFYEYDGTADVALPALHPTLESLDADWRTGEWRHCTCGEPSVDCLIYSAYNNCHWSGTVCLDCMVITSGFEPYRDDVERIDGDPSDTPA